MKLVIKPYRGQLAWFAEFTNYPVYPSWLIGRTKKLPTVQDAMRIVNAWKTKVIDGRPYHFDVVHQAWVAYGTSLR